MLTKIRRIQNFSRIKKCEWDNSVSEFKKFNLVYGPNGVGKTTVTNILSLISLNDNESKSKVLSEYTNLKDFLFDYELNGIKKSIDQKNITEKEKISIFNSAFVDSHVHNGTDLKTKGFSDVVTTEHLLNPQVKKIQKQLDEISDQSLVYKKNIEDIDAVFAKKKTEVSSFHNAKTSKFRMPTISIKSVDKSLESSSAITLKLELLYETYKQATNSAMLEIEIEKIKSVSLEKVVQEWTDLENVLNKNIKENSENRLKKMIHALSLDERLRNDDWGTWFLLANTLLKSKKDKNEYICPICESDLTIKLDKVLTEFSTLFTNEIGDLNLEIDNWLKNISDVEKMIDQNIYKLGSLKSSIKALGIEEKINKEIDANVFPLKDKIQLLRTMLEGKKGNFSKTFELDELLNEVNFKVNVFNEMCSEYYHNVKEEADIFQSKLNKPSNIEKEIRLLLERLVYAKTNEGLNNGNTLETYFKSKELLEKNSVDQIKLKSDLANELQKLRSESKYINFYLKKLGFYNFSIDYESKSQNGIAVRYGDIVKNDLSFSLSEGEKTALAFSYFLSKIKHEIVDNDKENEEEHIIVIDDPISSLDENRLNLTAFLIIQTFKTFHQLFIFSHNLIFLKVMGSQFDLKERSDYYLGFRDGIFSIQHTPYELTNYGTTYYLKLKELMLVKNGIINFEEAKKFVPNYSRIVLETFLSFKFFILKQGSSNEKFKTPGLDKLISFLSGNTNLFKDHEKRGNIEKDNVLEKLELIKKLTDGHSHGGTQLVDEYLFLTKPELDMLVDDTLNIIAFFDKVHFDLITSDKK